MKLHVHEWGDPAAPPLVCLHGVTGHGERYRRLAEEHWAKRFHVIAPDLRGHGRSDWEPPWTYPTYVADLVDTADALGIGEADWVGHSFGGRLMLELAASHPARIRRAVLLDPAIHAAASLQTAEHERADAVYASGGTPTGPTSMTPRALVLEDAAQHDVPDGDCADARVSRRWVDLRRDRLRARRRDAARADVARLRARASSDEQLDAYADARRSSTCPACTW